MKRGNLSISVDETSGGFVWRVWAFGSVRSYGMAPTYWGAHRKAAEAAERLES